MNSVKYFIAAATVIIGLSTAHTASAELTGNLGITSNYIFHGESQSNGSPALQGGLDYSHTTGLYVGTWASNVDKANASGVQVNTYGGFARQQGDFSYNIGAVTRQFTNSAHNHVNEAYLGGGYKMLHATYVLGDKYTYAEAVVDGKISGVHLSLRSGIAMPDQGKDVADYGFSLGHVFYGFDVKAGVATTNKKNASREYFISVVKPFDF